MHAFFLAALASLSAQDAAPRPSPVEIHTAPLVELWLEVRALAEAEGEPADSQTAAAVAAMRALGEALGPAAGFGLVEGNLVGAEDGAALRAAFAALPETRRGRDGSEVVLRAPCVAAAAALAALEPRWRAERWPERETALAAAEGRLQAALDAHGDALYARLARTLGLASEGVAIPVYLVTKAPWPGAFTHRRFGGGAVSFVSIEDDLSDLVEALLHETIHALDVSAPEGSLLEELRGALAKADVAPRPAHDWVHTLFFLEAGAAVRAELDPEHVDYGERTSLYARSQPMAGPGVSMERAMLMGSEAALPGARAGP